MHERFPEHFKHISREQIMINAHPIVIKGDRMNGWGLYGLENTSHFRTFSANGWDEDFSLPDNFKNRFTAGVIQW